MNTAKTIGTMLAAVLLLCLLPGSLCAALTGDVDADTAVTAADARLALRASVKLETLSPAAFTAADADHDGAVSAADARLLLRCSVGLEDLDTFHSYDAEEIFALPSCTTEGEKRHVCSCGAYISEPITATGHTPVSDAVISPTCTERGLTAGKHCATCGTVLAAQIIINARGHQYGDWTYDESSNIYRRVCKSCLLVDKSVGSDGLTYELTGLYDRYEITGYQGDVEDILLIPAEHDDLPVTGIREGAFAGQKITRLIIPASVASIGNGAFRDCNALRTADIYAHEPDIGSAVFEGCVKLESLRAPFCAMQLGAYFGTTAGKGLQLVKQRGSDDESSCDYYIPASLTSVTAQGSRLTDCSFMNCTMLTEIILSSGIEVLPQSSFNGCTGLTAVFLPTTLQTIAEDCFGGCTALMSIMLPQGLKTIGEGAFADCEGLGSIVLPSSLTTIAASAFKNCTSLTEFTIPDTVTNLGNGILEGCVHLASLSAPFETMRLGAYFGRTVCAGMTRCPQRYATEHTDTYDYYIPPALTSVTATGTAIVDFAFMNCTMLQAITVAESVTTTGTAVYEGCSATIHAE